MAALVISNAECQGSPRLPPMEALDALQCVFFVVVVCLFLL